MIVFCIIAILLSCSIIGKIPIPGTHTTLESLWIKSIERRVVYKPIMGEKSEYPEILAVPYIYKIYEDNIFDIKNYMTTSRDYTYKRVPIGHVYFSYSKPFGFHIVVNNLNNEIEKILLTQCFLIKENNEIISLLELQRENISQFFEWWPNDGNGTLRTSRGSGLLRFYDPIEIVIEKRESEYMDNIRFNFNNIPINWEIDTAVSIKYELEIYSAEGIKTREYQINYTRIFEEYIHERSNNKYTSEHEKIWNEINMDRWNRYLK